MEFSFPNSSLPFDEFIRYLNGGEYLDTFEVGSVKIPETIWPTVSRIKLKKDVALEYILNRPWIDPDRFVDDQKSCQVHKKEQLGFKNDDDLEKKRQLGFIKNQNPKTIKNYDQRRGPHDHPNTTAAATSTLKKTPETNNISKLIEEGMKAKKNKATAGLKKLQHGDEDDDEVEVRRILEEMSGTDLPAMLDDLDDSCIIQEKKKADPIQTMSKKDNHMHDEELTIIKDSNRKIKKQYNDEIESEKKKRKISASAEPSRPKKAPVKKKKTIISRMRSQLCARRMKLDPAMFI